MDKAWTSTVIEALRRLDPTRPADPATYVERLESERPEVRLELLVSAGIKVRALMVGSIGVGKSTEMLRWQERLSSGMEVLYIVVREPRRWEEGAVFEAILREAAPPDLRGMVRVPSDDVRRAVAVVAQQVRRPVVFLVDGFDLLPLAEAQRAFAPGSPLADPSLPPVVYTAPVGLLTQEGSTARDERFEASPWHIPPFAVLSPDRSPHEPGLQRLIDGLAHRLEGLDLFTSPGHAFRVAAFFSGGIMRDALRILRSAILAGAPAGRINDHHVQLGLREVRQDLEQGLLPYEVGVLRDALRGDVVLEPSLVASNRLIPYQGSERRFWLPHPLLWDLIEGHPAGAL